MGKNQSASGLTNIIQYDNNGNVSFVSGSTTLMQISSSGAITTTGVISGSNALSASYALNSGLLNGTGSVGFATTGSLLTVSSSQQQISASQQQLSSSFLILTASFNAVSASQQQISASYIALSASYTTFSGSASTRITVDSASLLQVSASYISLSGSYNTYSSSVSTRTTQIEQVYATTGSNSFRANQSITGSLVVSSTITAQTLIVQTVTSSIIYSSGSNIFGCDLNSRQTFTGSVLITGSLTIAGASSATSYSGTTIFGSTIACSPIGCFATSCATSFIGGTMSGTTIYGSTAVCSPVGKFTSCIDAGSGTFSGAVGINNALTITYGGGQLTLVRNTFNTFSFGTGIGSGISGLVISDNTASTNPLIIAQTTGAATFNSTITGTTIYGSTAICSAFGLFSGCVGVGCTTPGYVLDVRDGTTGSAGGRGMRLSVCSNSAGPQFRLEYQCSGDSRNWLIGTNQEVAGDFIIRNSTIAGCDPGGTCSATRFSINKSGFVSIGGTDAGFKLDVQSPGCAGTAENIARLGNIPGTNNGLLIHRCADNSYRYLFQSGIMCVQNTICTGTLVTNAGGLTENFDATGGGHINRYFAVKYMPENATTSFFKITTSGASVTYVHLAATNAGVGWYSSQVFHSGISAYWGGWVGSGTQISRVAGEAGYISGVHTDGSGNQTYCVIVANNGTSTSSLVFAYITTVTYAGYSTTFTQL